MHYAFVQKSNCIIYIYTCLAIVQVLKYTVQCVTEPLYFWQRCFMLLN